MIRAPMLASAVAEKVGPLDLPWDVYAERARRYEVQLNGARVEMVRGPLRLEGYGVRVLREGDGQTGVGFQASSDFTDQGVRATADAARAATKFNRFPAPHPELPAPNRGSPASPQILDAELWSDPARALDEEVTALLGTTDALRLPPPTFATLRATLVETSLANSRGLEAAYAHTFVEREIAVKAEKGPEGRPAGEYWMDHLGRRARLESLEDQVRDWYRYAEDARQAVAPPSGETTVALPTDVLSGILPLVLGFQFNGAALLRGMAVPRDSVVGPERLDVADDGLLDWAVGSSPIDDEGTAQRTRRVIARGRAAETLTDVLHANALGAETSGNAVRFGRGLSGDYWQKFTRRPSPGSSTIVLAGGEGGSDDELIEAIDDGIWVQQLGWANPDVVGGTFGGEIRIGYRIRHGRLAEPVRGGTVGGAVVTRDGRPSMLNGILAMGSRARSSGTLQSPTLVVKNLTVSGDDGAGEPQAG
jgi:predicted Zn-dependent protease